MRRKAATIRCSSGLTTLPQAPVCWRRSWRTTSPVAWLEVVPPMSHGETAGHFPAYLMGDRGTSHLVLLMAAHACRYVHLKNVATNSRFWTPIPYTCRIYVSIRKSDCAADPLDAGR